ncbi:unnamed protein product [Cylicostephanus goldi]|uniref:Uncharacterized protein n=1 Tax=Cylicostephanus goldi TaxID=71465 RepID=A0A3P6RYC0_CYLGO|nr:unnamed protein product [Cylicostephanus goldi]
MSSLALAYNVIITILYCASPSIRRRSRREKNVPKDEKGELNKDGDKEGNKDFKRKKGKSKELGDNVEKPAESSELQDGHEQVKPSEANVKKPTQSVDLQENREQLKPSEAKMKKLASASDVKESREQSKILKFQRKVQIQYNTDKKYNLQRSSKSPGQRKNAGEQEGAETDEIPAKGSKDKQDLRSPKQRKNADEQEGAETDEKPAKASKDKEGKVAKSAKVEADDVNLRTARGRVSSPQD